MRADLALALLGLDGKLEPSLDFGNHVNGAYAARVEAHVRQHAVPIAGTLTVAEQ